MDLDSGIVYEYDVAKANVDRAAKAGEIQALKAEIEHLKSEYGKVSVDIQSLCDTELKCRKLEAQIMEKDEALYNFVMCTRPTPEPAGGMAACGNCDNCKAAMAVSSDGSPILAQLAAAEKLYEILIQGTTPDYLSDHWKNIVERMTAYDQARERTK